MKKFLNSLIATVLSVALAFAPAQASVFIDFLSGATGTFDGVPSPLQFTGTYLRPPHLNSSSDTLTLTASKYYYAPIYLSAGNSFAGASFYNSNSAANGKNVKIAIYFQAATGGLGTLAKSFGSITLDGTSVLRQLASSWTVPVTGWYFLALTSDSNPALFGAAPGGITAAGASPLSARLPSDLNATAGAFLMTAGYSVAGTYANFPESTGLAPTSVLVIAASTGTAIPDFGLYK